MKKKRVEAMDVAVTVAETAIVMVESQDDEARVVHFSQAFGLPLTESGEYN